MKLQRLFAAVAMVTISTACGASASTWTGGTSQDWNTAGNWDSGPTGNFIVNTATGNYPVLSANSAFTPNDVIIGDGGTNAGQLDHTSGFLTQANTAAANGMWFIVGRGSNTASGIYNISGDASLTVGKLFAGGAYYGPGGTGTITINTTGTVAANSTEAAGYPFGGGGAASISIGVGDFGSLLGNGTLNLQNGTVTAGGPIWVGSHGGTGTLTQTGGTITTSALSLTRWRGTGTANISNGSLSAGSVNLTHSGSANDLVTGTANVGTGGTLNSEGDFVVAFAGSTASKGTLNVNAGGTVNVGSTVKRWFVVSQWDTLSGEVNVNGGALNLNTNTDLKYSIGNNSGANVVNLNSGSITSWAGNGSGSGASTSGVLDLNQASSGANNTFNLNGGTLTISGVQTNNNNGAANLNFNGGTLRATVNNDNFVLLGGANQKANVRDGGAVIDSNGFVVRIAEPLLAAGTGGLTKLGAGSLYLNGVSTYTGVTSLQAGTLGGSGSLVSGVVSAAGTTVAPGNSIGTFTVGSATLGGTLQIEYDGTGAGSIDLLNVLANLNISAATADFSQLGAAADDAAYIFATYGSLTGTFASTLNVPSGYAINYAYAGNNIALVAIPEPATLAAMLAAGAIVIRRRRA